MATLLTIAERVRKCTRCPLWKHRLQALPGSGKVSSRYVIILESPDDIADRKGDLWEGKAGRALLSTLHSLKVDRKDVFLTSLVKCSSAGSPVDKREIEECHAYLEEQLSCLVDARKIIVVSRRSNLVLAKNAIKVANISEIETVLKQKKTSTRKKVTKKKVVKKKILKSKKLKKK